MDEETERQFGDIANYCRGTCHNPLGSDRMETNPEFTFHYDIKKWLDDSFDKLSLDECILRNPLKGIFKLTDEKYKVVEDSINLFGTTFGGYYKGLKMVPQYILYRDLYHNLTAKNL